MNANTFFGNGPKDTIILVTSKNCSYCVPAKQILLKINKDIKIEDISLHPQVEQVPTLIINNHKFVGLRTEHEYRTLIKRYGNKRNNNNNNKKLFVF